MPPEEDPRGPHRLFHQPGDVSGEAAHPLQPAQPPQLLLRRPRLRSRPPSPARRLRRPGASSETTARGTKEKYGGELQGLADRDRDLQDG